MHQRHRRNVALQRRGSPTHNTNVIREDAPLLERSKVQARGLLDIPLPLPSIPVITPLLGLLDPLISFKPRVRPANPAPAVSSVAPPPSTPTQTPPNNGNNPGTGNGNNPGTGTGTNPGTGNGGTGNGNGGNPGTGTGTNPGTGNGNTPGTGTGGNGNGNNPGTGTGGTTPPDSGGGEGTTPGTGTGTTPGDGTNNGGTDTPGNGTTPSTGSGTTPSNGNGTGGTQTGGGGDGNPSKGTTNNSHVVNAGQEPGSGAENGTGGSSVASNTPAGSSTLVFSPSGINVVGGISSTAGAALPSDTPADTSAAASSGGGSGVAIGVGIAAGLIALIGGLMLLVCLRRRRRAREQAALVDPYAAGEKSMSEKNASPIGSLLNISRGANGSSNNLARISAASSFASPIAALPHQPLYDEDPFSDNSSHDQHGAGTVESSAENPFNDQNPFIQAQVFDPAFDAPTTAFPAFASPPPAAKLASGPSSGKYADLVRAGPPSPTVGEAWIDNRVSIASSASVHTITPLSFSQAMNQQNQQQQQQGALAEAETEDRDKHTSLQSTSSASHHPMGVFPIPIGDNGGTYTIRRPFLPTLSDEIAVATNEVVVLVRAFDDGWAFVSKTEGASVDGHVQTRGLIPIECFSVLDPRASSSSTVSRSSSLNH